MSHPCTHYYLCFDGTLFTLAYCIYAAVSGRLRVVKVIAGVAISNYKFHLMHLFGRITPHSCDKDIKLLEMN